MTKPPMWAIIGPTSKATHVGKNGDKYQSYQQLQILE